MCVVGLLEEEVALETGSTKLIYLNATMLRSNEHATIRAEIDATTATKSAAGPYLERVAYMGDTTPTVLITVPRR